MPQRFAAATPLFYSLLLLLGMFLPAAALHAQIETNPGISPPHPGLPHGNEDAGPFRDNPELRQRFEKSRAADRQKRIVDDANRLVALTTQYRQQVDAHGGPTEDDQKLLVQIEKIAREVKDRMRGM